MQVHEPAFCFSLHIAFDPQGDGEQGVISISAFKISLVQPKNGSPVYPKAHKHIGE